MYNMEKTLKIKPQEINNSLKDSNYNIIKNNIALKDVEVDVSDNKIEKSELKSKSKVSNKNENTESKVKKIDNDVKENTNKQISKPLIKDENPFIKDNNNKNLNDDKNNDNKERRGGVGRCHCVVY